MDVQVDEYNFHTTEPCAIRELLMAGTRSVNITQYVGPRIAGLQQRKVLEWARKARIGGFDQH